MIIWLYDYMPASMGGEQFQIVVRKPLSDLESELRARYKISGHFLDSSFIEDGAVVFIFGENPKEAVSPRVPHSDGHQHFRRKGRRRRTRTRGWKPIAAVTNSLGQRVRIYDVFTQALQDKQLGKTEQRKIVESLMRANGNEPTRDQVDYFLGNTLEYLHSRPSRPEAK